MDSSSRNPAAKPPAAPRARLRTPECIKWTAMQVLTARMAITLAVPTGPADAPEAVLITHRIPTHIPMAFTIVPASAVPCQDPRHLPRSPLVLVSRRLEGRPQLRPETRAKALYRHPLWNNTSLTTIKCNPRCASRTPDSLTIYLRHSFTCSSTILCPHHQFAPYFNLLFIPRALLLRSQAFPALVICSITLFLFRQTGFRRSISFVDFVLCSLYTCDLFLDRDLGFCFLVSAIPFLGCHRCIAITPQFLKALPSIALNRSLFFALLLVRRFLVPYLDSGLHFRSLTLSPTRRTRWSYLRN